MNKYTISLPVFLFLGCSKLDKYEEERDAFFENKDRTNSISYTKIRNYEEIRTVIHDKHWFILWTESGKGGIIHHPDCPICKK